MNEGVIIIMKLKIIRSRDMIASSFVALSLVFWSGSDFIQSYRRHGTDLIGEGVFLALALILMLGTALTIVERRF